MGPGKPRRTFALLTVGMICGALLGYGYATVVSSGPDALSRVPRAEIASSGSAVRGLDLRGQNLRGANLARANLRDANLTGAFLGSAVLQEAVLTNAWLAEAELQRADLTCAILRRANLSNATLASANLTGADLTGAYLRRADLFRANLRRATLRDAKLFGADLRYVWLDRAKLAGANLTDVMLAGATLTRADLAGATLTHADLCGANLHDVYLREANLRGARYDAATRWPAGFDPQAHGAVRVCGSVPSIGIAPPLGSNRGNTGSEAARQTAQQQRVLAWEAVARKLEALEAEDPSTTEGLRGEALRRELLARDESGCLQRAGEAAARTRKLARTPREAYRATLTQVRIEHDAGHHSVELRQARRLLELASNDRNARLFVQRAMRCNRREAPAVESGAERTRWREAP